MEPGFGQLAGPHRHPRSPRKTVLSPSVISGSLISHRCCPPPLTGRNSDRWRHDV